MIYINTHRSFQLSVIVAAIVVYVLLASSTGVLGYLKPADYDHNMANRINGLPVDYVNSQRVQLKKDDVFSLSSIGRTNYRRLSGPRPWITCEGPYCSEVPIPQWILCRMDYGIVISGDSWYPIISSELVPKCEAQLKEGYTFDTTDLVCEGFWDSDDDHFLKDSCAVVYTLKKVPDKITTVPYVKPVKTNNEIDDKWRDIMIIGFVCYFTSFFIYFNTVDDDLCRNIATGNRRPETIFIRMFSIVAYLTFLIECIGLIFSKAGGHDPTIPWSFISTFTLASGLLSLIVVFILYMFLSVIIDFFHNLFGDWPQPEQPPTKQQSPKYQEDDIWTADCKRSDSTPVETHSTTLHPEQEVPDEVPHVNQFRVTQEALDRARKELNLKPTVIHHHHHAPTQPLPHPYTFANIESQLKSTYRQETRDIQQQQIRDFIDTPQKRRSSPPKDYPKPAPYPQTTFTSAVESMVPKPEPPTQLSVATGTVKKADDYPQTIIKPTSTRSSGTGVVKRATKANTPTPTRLSSATGSVKRL